MDKCDTKLVFLSAMNHLVFDALKVKPLTFIRKSNMDKDFEMFLKLYQQDLFDRNKIKLSNEFGRIDVVYVDQIIYILACGHDVTLVTKNERYTQSGSLKKKVEELNDKWFVQIQKALCINLRYVDYVTGDVMHLKNNEEIKVSRFYKEKFLNRYWDYLLKSHV